ESFRPAGAHAARADYCWHSHISHLHGAGDNCPWHRRYSDGTLSRLGVSQSVPTAAPGENNSGSELKKLKVKIPKQSGTYEYSERVRNTEGSITRGVGTRATRPAQSGEGAHAAQRRVGTAAAGTAVGSGRETVSLRDGRRERLAGGSLSRPLAASCLSLHVRARLQGGLRNGLHNPGRFQRLCGSPCATR